MAAGQIRIKGQAEVEAAFLSLRKEVLAELRPALREIAQPVRELASEKAMENIRNIGAAWSRMRVGVTTKVVYIAPTSRRHGGSPRPNLAALLMDKAMQPALDESQGEIVAKLDALVDLSAARSGF